MRKNKKIIRETVRWMSVVLLCLLMAGSVFAESASEEQSGKQREQWVFLLAAPEDDSECRFFVNPSLAGYEAGEDTDIQLIMDISGKRYDIMLSPSDVRRGWYISEVYDIAAAAWKMDYQVTLKMTDGGDLLLEEKLDKKDIAAKWPDAADGELKLKKDGDGRLENSEFEWPQWMSDKDNPLFTYKIDTQEDCEVVLDQTKDKIKVLKAANRGQFVLAAEDPAGNRRMAKVDIIVAGQVGNGITGVIAVVVIAVIVIAVLAAKHFGNGGSNQKAAELVQAKKEADEVCQRLDYLMRDIETLKQDIIETGHIAEDRVRQDGAASAYSLADIRKIEAIIDGLDTDISFNNVTQMVQILKVVSGQLLKMQGKAKVNIKKDGLSAENPKNYISEASRKDILSKIEPDEAIVKEVYTEMEAALKTLKEVAYREEMPFYYDMDILVEADGGRRQYRCKRVAKDTYGVNMPGVFALDGLKLLSREGSWMTLPEILNHETDVRLFAIDEMRIRAVAANPVLLDQGRKTRIVEYTYDEAAEIVLEDAKIILHFKG